MKNLPASLLAALVAFSTLGCRKAESQTDESAAKERTLQQAAEPSNEAKAKLSALVGKLKQSLNSGDLAKAKDIGRHLDAVLSQRVVGWYVEVLKLEEKQGVEAARERLRVLKDAEGVTEEERKALDVFGAYFREKGGIKTKEAFEVLVKLYLEIKLKGFSVIPHN